MAPQSTKLEIAIIGGGMVGLCTALGLLSRGITPRIYEATAKYEEIGAGVALSPNAISALHLISPQVKAAVESCITKNLSEEEGDTWFTVRYGGTPGDEEDFIMKIKTIDEAKTGMSSVHRARFLEKLVTLIPEGVKRFNKRLVGIEEVVEKGRLRLEFSDETFEEADAVLGADGIHSRVSTVLENY
jgi:salicylate hydroxylase